MTITYGLESKEIKHLSKVDDRLCYLFKKYGGLSFELYDDLFSFVIFSIIGQMLSNKISDVLCDRLDNLLNNKINAEKIVYIGKERIKEIGISSRKTDAIYDFSVYFLNNKDFFQNINNYNNESIIDALCEIKGIGSWTSKMVLIFVLGRLDVIPTEDTAFVNAFEKLYHFSDKTRDKRLIKDYCQRWMPYSSLGCRILYKALDDKII